MDVICIIDKTKADNLSNMGFSYIAQQVENTTIYQFIKTPELERYINSNYSNREFFINKNLNF